ncbi:hypothetical protein [Mycobacteroides abscessus]|uniref:hypothetical protein n=1 Tax=Mycobacteroides abscessus TaxID=36809 RepID=UPI0016006225|nr:hypothetical protein [Mycobacteroides abscessus]
MPASFWTEPLTYRPSVNSGADASEISTAQTRAGVDKAPGVIISPEQRSRSRH